MIPISTLWHLQTLDLERDEKLHRTDQIAQSLANDPKVAAAQTARDAENDRLTLLRTNMQDAELHAKSLDSKIKEIEARLASGRVTNPKELDSLEKDRQMHLRHQSNLDTTQLELMDALERTLKQVDEKGTALKKSEAAHNTDVSKLEHERDALTQRLADIETEHGKTRAALDPGTLATYDRLRQSKAGRAIAQLKNSGCDICGMQLPTGLLSSLEESEDLVFCPDCGRILTA